jgi:single-strand DNA-binding protein
MNKVFLMGRLVKDPEIRYSRSEPSVAVCSYHLAVERRFKKQGEQDVDYIKCLSFGKSAEWAEKYLKKGTKICVIGRLQVRGWSDNDGSKRWSTEVIVEETYFAEGKAAAEKRDAEEAGFMAIDESIEDDELPF